MRSAIASSCAPSAEWPSRRACSYTSAARSARDCTKGGEVFYGKDKEYISDCVGDADTDLLRCILPHVSDPNKMSGHLFVDDLMAAAGYVNGEKFSLKSPVILHKDNNPTNFNSDNLKWVESTDPRYIEYQKKVKEWKHQRNLELNHDW